ncbi:MAG TPA: hypothetical protein VI318_03185 [Baekduia sp.]
MPEATPLPILMSEPTARDACASCGTPLGASARYCLTCGTRRAGARPAFLEVRDEPPTAVPPVTLPQPDAPHPWPFAVTAAVLLALLVGLLTGHLLSDRDDHGTATQVIRVEGQGASAALPAATAAPSTAAPATTAAAPAPTDAGATK